MKKLNLLLAFFIVFGAAAQNREMKVASFNVRNDNSSDATAGNGWGNRMPVIVNMILFHDFDIVGTQECKVNQVVDLRNTLSAYNYDVIGRGRGTSPTDDEFSAIFYKTDRYILLNHGDFWLSQTPNVPSIGWDAAMNRICTWGYFEEKTTGFKFYAFNLHNDHIGVTARLESAKLVLQKIRDISAGAPTMLTGDFNVDQNSEVHAIINSSDILEDCYNLSPIKLATNGSINLFELNIVTVQRIDHIFVTVDFTPVRYGILTDNYWTDANGTPSHPENFPAEVTVQQATPRLPSDHYPVVVGLRY